MGRKANAVDTTALMGDFHINLTDEQRAEMEKDDATQSPLYIALRNAVYDHAEYSHPCDADELRIDRATGAISIHTLLDLLEEHGN